MKIKILNSKEKRNILKRTIKEIKVLKIRKNHLVILTIQNILIKKLMTILKKTTTNPHLRLEKNLKKDKGLKNFHLENIKENRF